MLRRLLSFGDSHASMLLAVGLSPWLEGIVTVKWVLPQCSIHTEGPTWHATGFPLPYQVFAGNSLEYDFMPHLYLVNLAVYAGGLFLALKCFQLTSPRMKRMASLVGVALSFTFTAGLLLAMKDSVLTPVVTIGSDTSGRYIEYRPVGLSLSHQPGACEGSEFWFPEAGENR